MTGTMTWAAMDVHARSIYAASMDVITGEFVSAAVRHGRGGAGGRVVGGVAGAGACVLRGRSDRVRALPGGGRGRCRVSGDRAIEDGARLRGSRQVRSSRHRSSAAPVDGRGADAGRGPVAHVRGGPRSREGARAGQGRSDALPATPLEAAVASRPGVGPLGVDQDAPRVAGIAGLRASQHRAGVHRQPRRVRRADRSPDGARRTPLAHRDRPRVLAGRVPVARVPRDRHALRADPGARDRRLHPLPARGAARIVAGAGALPRAVRRDRPARVDHQDRLQVRAADPGPKRAGITPVRRGSGGRSTSARKACPTTSCRSHAAPRPASTASTNGCASTRSPGT